MAACGGYLVIFFLAILTLNTSGNRKVLKAPHIIKHPPTETSYKLLEDMVLNCLADADSNPIYTWTKGNETVDLSGHHISLIQPGSGEITIRSPTDVDDGVYQCFASNELGTAATTRTIVKKAFLDPFPTVTDPEHRTPTMGESLTIPCTSPRSYPKGVSYWGINRPGTNKMETLLNDDRVLLDYDGNLHFANVLMNDSQSDLSLVCIVYNSKLGAYVQGDDNKVRPRELSGSEVYHAPHLLWSSPMRDIAVKGDVKKMKCIFAGLPTPRVSWRRSDDLPLSGRVRFPKEHYGTEIEISSVEEEDGGRYECSAVNRDGGSPVIQEITLIVHSRPFWNQDKPPASVETDEEGEAEFDCQAHGTPKPNITWGINGVSLYQLPPNPRRTVEGTKVRYHDLTKTDTQVLQCVATNEHGSILANAYLTVFSAFPSFLKAPSDAKVVQGQTVKFECRANGSPKPKISWQSGSPATSVSGSRFNVLANGDLEIKNALVEDSTTYQCNAQNKLGVYHASAMLIVRSPTVIVESPQNVLLNKSSNATLRCGVETDSAERSNLRVEWRKNEVTIDFAKDTRVSLNAHDFSLFIRHSRVDDTASYTCHANNGLDSADSNPAKLTVQDRPEPPIDVRVAVCSAESAQVRFRPDSDNNSPITSFTVYYSLGNTAEFVEGATVRPTSNGQDLVATIPVRPWRTYSFRVTATNVHGVSDPSVRSQNLCDSPQTAPQRNPLNVCTKNKASTQLNILWDIIPQDEHLGEGFHYIVNYRPLSSSEPPLQEIVVNPRQAELVIHDQPVFTKYEIYVQAANNIDRMTIRRADRRIGYSGEGKPMEAPRNFRLNGDKFNGTNAEFVWDPVHTSPDIVRGFFRGYRIKFWRTNDPNDVRHEDIILNSQVIDRCPMFTSSIREERSTGPVYGATGKLWPSSRITAGVAVLNTAHDGVLSNTFEFNTTEGPPGAVKSLIVIEVGSSHLIVTWTLPAIESSGIIKSFILEYQVAPPAVGLLQQIFISNPQQLSKKILELESSTVYRLMLSAKTSAGTGEALYLDAETLPASNPDKPYIDRIEAGVDSANISFVSSRKKPAENPGSQFHVEFIKEEEGTNKWNKTSLDPHDTDNWINITDLTPGVYSFRVVASNGVGDHIRDTRSEKMTITIGERRDYEGTKPEEVITGEFNQRQASVEWFIALMCIILFLLIILLIICCIKRSQGEMYPVYEKEKMLGRDPYSLDDAPFGEYNGSGRPDTSRSRVSLDSEEKPLDSDSDSLGEYEDHDASKFNEDGSFIGLYTGKNKQKSPDATSPTAVNTFV